MSVDIRLPSKRGKLPKQLDAEPKHIVSPGDVITEDIGYMRFVFQNIKRNLNQLSSIK